MNQDFRPLIAAAALIFGTVVTMRGAQATPPQRSTRDGVFTVAQADRGKMVFEGVCTDCHTPDMWGSDWDTRTVGDLYEFISQNMPKTAPGTLTPPQARDVISFVLQSNSVPAGMMELPTDVDAMKQIRMERTK